MSKLKRPSIQIETGQIEPILFQQNPGYWQRWTGTREQFIDAELCKPDQFPKGRKRVKDFYVPGGTHGWIKRKAGGRFELFRSVTNDERKAEEKEAIENTPEWNTPEDYRADLVIFLVKHSCHALASFSPTKPTRRFPFRLSDEAEEAIMDSLREINQTLEGARIIDSRPKAKRFDAKAAAAAVRDVALQRFLNRIQGKEA